MRMSRLTKRRTSTSTWMYQVGCKLIKIFWTIMETMIQNIMRCCSKINVRRKASRKIMEQVTALQVGRVELHIVQDGHVPVRLPNCNKRNGRRRLRRRFDGPERQVMSSHNFIGLHSIRPAKQCPAVLFFLYTGCTQIHKNSSFKRSCNLVIPPAGRAGHIEPHSMKDADLSLPLRTIDVINLFIIVCKFWELEVLVGKQWQNYNCIFKN